ncbi:MAG: hypothetical protein HYY48_10595 [Gammaproteobacteria bacterium]|nr:hypothetical protein [Gammaproteobacteria bacterium]
MSLTVLDLNDSELRIARAGRILARSPGVAVIRDGRMEIGEAAAKTARLNPRHAFNRFWRDLNQDELRIPTNQARHHADLAFSHLLAVHELAGKPQEIIIAVPGCYNTGQLALLLGLVQASPFTAVGLIDAGVAAAASGVPAGNWHHVDLHLHYAIVTAVKVADLAERLEVSVIEGAGVQAVHDRCAAFIADLFIQQARLDPLHHAATEQALYDQLPACLHTLRQRNEVVLEIQFENVRYQARLVRDALIGALEPVYDRIAAALSRATGTLLSHRVAGLPQFAARLPASRTLDEMAVFTGCMQFVPPPRSADPGLSFVTRLKAAAAPAPAATDVTARSPEELNGEVTHVLIGSTAYPLASAPIYVSSGARVADVKAPDSVCSLALGAGGATVRIEGGVPAYLNGRNIAQAAPLRPGDAITFAGSDLVLLNINVVERHAAR